MLTNLMNAITRLPVERHFGIRMPEMHRSRSIPSFLLRRVIDDEQNPDFSNAERLAMYGQIIGRPALVEVVAIEMVEPTPRDVSCESVDGQ